MSTITIEPSIKLTDMLYTTLPWLCYDLFVHDGFGDQLHLRLAEHRPHIFDILLVPTAALPYALYTDHRREQGRF